MMRRVAVLGLLLLSIPVSLLAGETNTSTKDPQSEKRGGEVILQELFGEQAAMNCCITCSNGSHWTFEVSSVNQCLDTCEFLCGGPCTEGGGCF